MTLFVRGIKAVFVLITWVIYEMSIALSNATEYMLWELIKAEEGEDQVSKTIDLSLAEKMIRFNMISPNADFEKGRDG